MPANLTPEFYQSREKFHRASTPEEKISALQQMLRTIPKHKGTDKMQANIKKQLSKLKIESQKQKSQGKQKPFWIIEKQGAARIVLVGPPNSGKSQFLKMISNANTEVANYPYTTQKPIPGMAIHKHIQFQVIDLPPYTLSSPGWINEVIRTSDLILLFLDISNDNILIQIEELNETLSSNNLTLTPPLRRTNDDYSNQDFIDDEDIFMDANSREAIIVANKCDRASFDEIYELFTEFVSMFDINNLPIVKISSTESINIKKLFDKIFEDLQIIRAYTKAPGQEPNYTEPVALRKGDTLLDLAMVIHKDFANNLKYARVWGVKTYDGQKVSKDYVLCDKDIVEFHI
ncbi:MAG: GTPase [Clostridia bacterium]